ncbi:ribosome maturation factor RimP [bacterium]|nr:ribosome maturation factor RimP [bacterium]
MSLGVRIQELLSPILESEKAELVDLEIKGKQGGSKTIKIFVDAEGGINLKKCESISRRLADELDMEEDGLNNYRLEVSSPGVDRPLRKIEDFGRNVNKDVEVVYDDDHGQKSFRGKIVLVSEDVVELQGKRETKRVGISQIKLGKIILPW